MHAVSECVWSMGIYPKCTRQARHARLRTSNVHVTGTARDAGAPLRPAPPTAAPMDAKRRLAPQRPCAQATRTARTHGITRTKVWGTHDLHTPRTGNSAARQCGANARTERPCCPRCASRHKARNSERTVRGPYLETTLRSMAFHNGDTAHRGCTRARCTPPHYTLPGAAAQRSLANSARARKQRGITASQLVFPPLPRHPCPWRLQICYPTSTLSAPTRLRTRAVAMRVPHRTNSLAGSAQNRASPPSGATHRGPQYGRRARHTQAVMHRLPARRTAISTSENGGRPKLSKRLLRSRRM